MVILNAIADARSVKPIFNACDIKKRMTSNSGMPANPAEGFSYFSGSGT
jgi:hypothetical protein